MLSRLLATSALLTLLTAALTGCSYLQTLQTGLEQPPLPPRVEVIDLPQGQYLASEIPPCTPAQHSDVDPCAPGRAWIDHPELHFVLDVDKNNPYPVAFFLNGARDIVPHMVVRGTYLPDTIRCSTTRFRPRPYRGPEAYGSLRGSLTLICYADVRVNAYILGSGPPRITVKVAHDTYAETSTDDQIAELTQMWLDFLLVDEVDIRFHEDISIEAIPGREAMMFIGPMVDSSVQALRVFETWRLERKDNGTVVATHPYRKSHSIEEHRDAVEIELPRFREQVLAAQAARVEANGGRVLPEPGHPMLITDVHDLRDYYVEVGAYDDPTALPVMPPPVETCANTAAVGPDADPALVKDCDALLGMKSMLAGTASLNWSKDLAMTAWQGIRLGGNPQRVHYLLLANAGLNGALPVYLHQLTELRRIDLDENSLTGNIPPQLGMLKKLTHLYFFENQLSGPIPPELGQMTALQVLYPEDNQLTGEIPETLGNLARLTQLVLANNQLSGPIPDSLGKLSNLEHLRLRDNNLSGQIPRALSSLDIRYLGLSGNAFTGCLPTGLHTGGNDDLWRPELQALPTCGPTFRLGTQDATLATSAPAGTAVATVEATPYESGDDLTYAITRGNEDGLYAVDPSTGAVTTARTLTGAVGDVQRITLTATDQQGQTSPVLLRITLT